MVKTAVALLIIFGGIYAGAAILDKVAKKKEHEGCQCGCGGHHEEEHECCGQCKDCQCHKESVLDKVEETVDEVEDIIEEAADKVEELVEELRAKIEDIAEDVVEEVKGEVQELVEEVKKDEE